MRLSVFAITCVMAGTAVAQTQIPISAFTNTYSYATHTRGFWFEVPLTATPFVITGLRVPDETMHGTQHVEVQRFPTNPPSGVGTSLFYSTGQPSANIIPCSILVQPGEVIGVLGACGDATIMHNSYGAGGYASNVLGAPITLSRLYTQTNLATANNQTAVNGGSGSIARVEVYVQPATGYASATSFGVGCNNEYASFYENHTAFDLSNTSLSLQFLGNGYAALPGATPLYVPTSTPVTIGDDQVLQFPLGWTLPYPGGTTTDLWVSSNGFVNATTNTLSGCCSFNLTQFLSNGPCWAAKWRDLNPSASGSVYFDTDATTGTAYVTFDMVPDYGSTTNLNTFQYAFDQAGNVELRFGTVAPTAGGTGWSPGAANLDPGSVDISALPVILTGANDVTPIVHGAGARPVLGTTISLETTNLPANTMVGATLLGLTDYNPGIDLGPIGMPGCSQYVSTDATLVWIAAGNMGSSSFAIPNNNAFAGLVINSQGASLSPGVNAVGALTSNGLALTIDIN